MNGIDNGEVMMDRFVLQELFGEDLPFRVHNVKISQLMCELDLPMMFLAQYDSLDDDLKAQYPLNSDLLKHMNDKVTADEACAMIGIPEGSIRKAMHIKIVGTTVLVLDDFPLAVHLQFTNTAKSSQAVQSDDKTAKAHHMRQEANKYQFAGNVNILHKNSTKTLVSMDLSEGEFVVPIFEAYTALPNSHALATTHTLNTLKNTNPSQMAYITSAIEERVLQEVGRTVE